jgi:uncharacterized membrane protein YkoI
MKPSVMLVPALLASCASPRPAAAPPSDAASLGDCVKAVQAAHAGIMVKVEGKTEEGKDILEFDVRSPDGTQWDIECEAVSGKVTEVEQEVASAAAEPFKSKVKVPEAEARKTALAAHAGEIVEVEYEIEANGDASYEFEIAPAVGGDQLKVEVDASSGKIVEDHPELYQIGVE